MIRSVVLLLTTLLAATQTTQADSIKLGVTVPLTGDFASYGELIREGVELAKDDLTNQGHSLKVIYEDACLPAEAVTAINKLVLRDKIDILAANFCVVAVPPMAQIIERSKIIAFHTASASDSILDAGKYIFTTNIKVRNEARRIAEYVFDELGARKAGVLYVTTDFGEDYNHHFKQRFEELGGKVVSSDTSPPGRNDFRAEIVRVKGKAPDVIFAAHLGPSLGVLLKQIRQAGLQQQIIGVYEAEDPSVLEIGGASAEGLRFFVPEPMQDSPRRADFRRRFNARFGHNPRILASNAYDATILSVSSFVACKRDPECTRNKLLELRDYDGVSGKFSIDSDGGTIKDFVLKEVRGAEFKRR